MGVPHDLRYVKDRFIRAAPALEFALSGRNFTEERSNQEDEALAFLDEVMECTPAISENDVQTIERAFSDPEWAYARRTGLELAMKGGDWF